ncbi:hypothetical protein [Puniceibacterium confluentis]|uniref:hypothetical protein n=1 Tax=Puniceibacterium confluentis TaxID=1958944 RepID=UPI0011B410A8|nr:hypothetical protein [Puniceibacterium confluentis]
MDKISTIRDLVALWPSRQIFAQDLDVPVVRVHKWITANSIPAKYQKYVLDSASARALPVSAPLILEIHAETRSAA